MSHFEVPYLLKVNRLVTSNKTAEWCRLPYPGHPKGCPNVATCVDKERPVHRLINVRAPLYLVYSEFDLTTHVERMRVKHPAWSERQLHCVLYWQGTSRKQLRQRVKDAERILEKKMVTLYCPEAAGVNVFVTARLSGLRLERTRSIQVCHHVALLGEGL